MVRLVLFDVDGTLIRTNGAGVRAFARAFETEFQLPAATQGVSFAGRTDTSLVRECLSRHGIEATQGNFQRFFDAYVFWLDHHLQDAQGGVCAGVRQWLDDLKALQPRPLIGLLTGNIRLGAELKLRRYGLWDDFETGGFGDDDEDRGRIAAAARDRGSRLLGCDLAGEEILVIGDTPHDIACGRAIGARVLAVSTGGAGYDQLEAHQPDWVVADLTQLTAVTACTSPASLRGQSR